MPRRTDSETPSLKWIHRIREQHYRRTKGLPLDSWLRPADAQKVAQSFRRLGLKVRIVGRKQRVRSRG
jgi:hypothetical protein